MINIFFKLVILPMKCLNTSMFFLRNILLLLTFFMQALVAQAMSFDVQTEQVRWQYQEYAKDITGFSAYLPSISNGHGTLLQMRLNAEPDLNWSYALQVSWMAPTLWTQETWHTTQTNALRIQQQDVRLDVLYRVQDVQLGLWLAYRHQKQKRRDFFVNGNYTPVAGEPIPEAIISHWFGLSVIPWGGEDKQLQVALEAALPLQVKVNNPLFAKPFSKNNGYRAGIHLRWHFLQRTFAVSGLHATLGYELQELGGEKKVSGNFWPYNRWQMLSFGLLYAW